MVPFPVVFWYGVDGRGFEPLCAVPALTCHPTSAGYPFCHHGQGESNPTPRQRDVPNQTGLRYRSVLERRGLRLPPGRWLAGGRGPVSAAIPAFTKSAIGFGGSPDRKSTRLNSSHMSISY